MNAIDYAGTGPYDRPPISPYVPRDERHEAPLNALDGVPLGDFDRRIVDWLAGWDDPTARVLCGLFLRVRAAALITFVKMTRAVNGADLRAGDVLAELMPDGSIDTHRIDHLAEYPGAKFVGDHARRAYGQPTQRPDSGGWRATVGDHQHYYVLIGSAS